jgi:hypothetical protein
MKRIPAKHREDLLLDLLADIANGELKGERLTAYDVSAMGNPRAINIDDDAGGSRTYTAALQDLERLADEGYLEVDWRAQSLEVSVLRAAQAYRDELRTIELAKGQTPKPE